MAVSAKRREIGENVVARILVDVMDLEFPVRLAAHAARSVGSKGDPIGKFLRDSYSILFHCDCLDRLMAIWPLSTARP